VANVAKAAYFWCLMGRQLTNEQQQIVAATGNIIINAVAGSGKTTTLIEFAKSRPAGSRILYIAFNKSVKLEAQQKFAENGAPQVVVETAHSLAYRQVVPRYGYRVKGTGYKTQEIARMLGLTGNGEKHAEYMVANHINKFITYFCNSSRQRVQELNYLDTVSEAKARTFVEAVYTYLEAETRKLLAKMNSGEIEITHDFYLKKFQLSKPHLPFDYILFDEGQDASEAMLDIFLQQPCTKVIVGDTHQQIYGWRYAVNSLEKTDFTPYQLSVSFRFPQAIANLANRVLQYKNILKPQNPVAISGLGKSNGTETKALIARSNLGLLLKAIAYLGDPNAPDKIYFEGNFSSYTYAEDGTSLYDILNLKQGKMHLVRDPLIKAMKDVSELQEYIDKTEDHTLNMMLEIVQQYGEEIPELLKELKAKQVDNANKASARLVFSTLHKCKGLEYDVVELADDFITEKKLEDSAKVVQESPRLLHGLLEEVNLLYVAITRAKNKLYIPEKMLPGDIFPSSHIVSLAGNTWQQNWLLKPQNTYTRRTPETTAAKSYSVQEVRKKHEAAYKPWTEEDDETLTLMYLKGTGLREIAQVLGRTAGAIQGRIRKLELEDLYG
jgi:superfamily I DNA/RNA helicase